MIYYNSLVGTKYNYPIVLLILLLLPIIGLIIKPKNQIVKSEVKPEPAVTITASPSPSPGPTIRTVKKLTLAEMDKLYGPCTKVPVLMFHHIQEAKIAKEKQQGGLNVTPEEFRKNLEYIKAANYAVISTTDLADFFDHGKVLPVKPLILTFDDAYEDNYSVMYPILREYGFTATIFTPTGLVQNPEYLSWKQIKEMNGLVYFGNHTWSHHSSTGSVDVLEKEISLADKQLAENGQNNLKIFAYPYGNPSDSAEKVLQTLGYKLAFTTVNGTIQCKGKRYELPRIRVANDLKRLGL